VKKTGLFTLKTTACIAALSLSTSLVYGTDSSAEKSVSDLPSSLNEALNTNPEILFQKAEKDASGHKVTQSIGTYLPSVDLRAGYGREYIRGCPKSVI
jgi:outer membrane protein TolC